MSPTEVATSAERYRTRHAVSDELTAIPASNLLWRDPKVPLRKRDARVQLELLGPEELTLEPPPGLPNPDRLMRERIDRTIQDTLSGLRPNLNRLVRDVQTHLEGRGVRCPEQRVVDEALEVLESHLQRYVSDALAFKTWSSLHAPK